MGPAPIIRISLLQTTVDANAALRRRSLAVMASTASRPTAAPTLELADPAGLDRHVLLWDRTRRSSDGSSHPAVHSGRPASHARSLVRRPHVFHLPERPTARLPDQCR